MLHYVSGISLRTSRPVEKFEWLQTSIALSLDSPCHSILSVEKYYYNFK